MYLVIIAAGIAGVLAIHAMAAEPGPPTRITPAVAKPAQAPQQAQARENPGFKDTACQGRPNGLYCGTGDGSRLRFQCTRGEIAFLHSCPGGCEERTLQCRQNIAVKPADSAAAR